MFLAKNKNSCSGRSRYTLFAKLLLVIFSLVVFLSACKDPGYKGGDWAARYITVDSSAAKKVFAPGEEFDDTGLSISAFFSRGDLYYNNYETKTIQLKETEFKVDAFNFNPQKAGEYVIYITYNWEDKSLCETHYLVRVV